MGPMSSLQPGLTTLATTVTGERAEKVDHRGSAPGWEPTLVPSSHSFPVMSSSKELPASKSLGLKDGEVGTQTDDLWVLCFGSMLRVHDFWCFFACMIKL